MLADLNVERRTVQLKGGSFEVEGLSLESFAVLVRTHLPDLEDLFAMFDNVENMTIDDVQKLASKVVMEAPGFAANVIALAAGEPEQAPRVQKLPFPVQVQTLMDIGDLTFSEVGGVKKFLPVVADLLGMTGTVEKAKAAIMTRAKAL